MSGISINFLTPAQGSVVGRTLRVTGSVTPFNGHVTSITVQIGAGTLPLNATRGTWNWSWEGPVPNVIRPGQTFQVLAQVTGVMTVSGAIDPVDVSGQRTANFILENIVPQLTVDPFQTPMVITEAAYPFALSGRLTEGAGWPYVPTLTYRIGSAAAGTVTPFNGTWITPAVMLPPGDYPITVTAQDNFASSVTVTRTLRVLKYQPPATPDPAAREMANGLKTTGSVTSWTRLEPQVAAGDPAAAASARLFDPLWMLTRQWQLGEFQGEDAGSPVQARIQATSAILSRFHPGELKASVLGARAYAPSRTPLEALVEQRPMRPKTPADSRMLAAQVQSGLTFLRMLEGDPVAAKYAAAFTARYALTPLPGSAQVDAETQRFVALMAGRAVDARQLADAFSLISSTTFKFDAALAILTADVAAVQKVAAAWQTAHLGLFAEPAGADAWMPSRLEYALSVSTRFSLSASDNHTLSASEFDGSRLDWTSFDVNRRFVVDSMIDTPFLPVVSLSIPAAVTIRGAPAARFWELEDSKLAYGLVPVGPADTAHMLMIEYDSSYGNDWYVAPLTLRAGSVTRVNSLVVTDTFGIRSLLRPMGHPSLPPAYFSMWQSSIRRYAGDPPQAPISNAFFLPPSLGRPLDGPSLEEVQFMRDEMANLGWAIERTVEGGLGDAVTLPTAAAVAPAAAAGSARYQLSTPTPPNWIPLMPVQVGGVGPIRLRPAATLQADDTTAVNRAHSAVLNAAPDLMLFDEEIPREGVSITLRRRMTRWIDGSTWVWTGFRSQVGRGEGTAGLRFDQVDGLGPP